MFSEPENQNLLQKELIQTQIECAVDALIKSLFDPEHLPADQGRGITGRYAAVLEGNFIYWMTGAYLSARSEIARSVILKNLHEQVRDSHPDMLRTFAFAPPRDPKGLGCDVRTSGSD
jgi:hypothetical protein